MKFVVIFAVLLLCNSVTQATVSSEEPLCRSEQTCEAPPKKETPSIVGRQLKLITNVDVPANTTLASAKTQSLYCSVNLVFKSADNKNRRLNMNMTPMYEITEVSKVAPYRAYYNEPYTYGYYGYPYGSPGTPYGYPTYGYPTYGYPSYGYPNNYYSMTYQIRLKAIGKPSQLESVNVNCTYPVSDEGLISILEGIFESQPSERIDIGSPRESKLKANG